MRRYTYYWGVDSVSGELRVSTDVDRVTGRCHDYHQLRASNIKEAWAEALKRRGRDYTADGLPRKV